MSGKLVAVTGASGYVAGVLIDLLVQHGYRVRGTVRNLLDHEKVGHLKKDFPNVELFEADLMKVGSFQDAFQGVEIVFHTASPFQLKADDPQRDLIDPAVKGTENVVTTALQIPSVKTIVVTSSCAAVRGGKPEGAVYNEDDWNNVATIETTPYPLSKVLAERKAWELVDAFNATSTDHKIKLVTVCPTFVVGPPFGTRVDGTSVSTFVKLLDGTFVKEGGIPKVRIPCVDVRDVAKAHVEAAERSDATGRFIVSSPACIEYKTFADVFRTVNPDLLDQIPTDYREGQFPPEWGLDRTKAMKVLGIDFIPIEKSLEDMSHKLREIGLVKKL